MTWTALCDGGRLSARGEVSVGCCSRTLVLLRQPTKRCPVRISDSTLEFPRIETTKLWFKTRSGTWAKWIYPWRLMSSCRAPFNPLNFSLSRLARVHPTSAQRVRMTKLRRTRHSRERWTNLSWWVHSLLSIYMSIYIYPSMSVYPSVYLSVSVYSRLSRGINESLMVSSLSLLWIFMYIYICPSIHLYLSIRLFIYLYRSPRACAIGVNP